MQSIIDPAILLSDAIRYTQDWLTTPPADLRPDSTDKEVVALSHRIIDEAVDRGLPLWGSSPVCILLRMRSDLSGYVWKHTYTCDACGRHEACQVSCLAPSADRWYVVGDPECPWGRKSLNGEDIAVWKYRGAKQVPIQRGDA